MNSKQISVSKAVANHSGAMETETISKNGASSKSRMSRGYITRYLSVKKLFVATVVAVFFFGFTSCKKECKCTMAYYKGSQEAVVVSGAGMSSRECKDAEKKYTEERGYAKCIME